MTKTKVKEKLNQVCPNSVCYFYGISIYEFNKHQLENLTYLLMSSIMDKDKKKVWRDNGFSYLVRKEISNDPIKQTTSKTEADKSPPCPGVRETESRQTTTAENGQ